MLADLPRPQPAVQHARAQRALRAVLFGAVAAIAGSVLYLAIVAVTGLYFGIFPVVIAYLVGFAVAKGARRRGGWAYQSLAIVLTYLGIAGTYLPLVAKELQKSPPAAVARKQPAMPMADTITISARGPDVGRAIDSAAAARRDREVAAARPPRLQLRTALLGTGTLLLIASILPIAVGAKNVVNLLIIAVALFEAWRLNRRAAPVLSRPYRLTPAEPRIAIG